MLDKIDRKTLFDGLKPILGVKSFTQAQVDGLESDISNMEIDPLVPPGKVGLQRCAYWIYTDWIESGYTFQPVKEKGNRAYFLRMYGPDTKRGHSLGNDDVADTLAYVGKGKPQVTGENNYEAVENLIRTHYPWIAEKYERETGKKFDLTRGDQPDDEKDPDNMLRADVSYVAMIAGTTFGLYGPPVGHYINEKGCDYGMARHSVNGRDRASEFTEKCPRIERVLITAASAATEDPPPTTATTDVAEPAEAAPAVQPPTTVVENAQTVVSEAQAPQVPQEAQVQATEKDWLKKFKEMGAGAWTAITGASATTLTFITTSMGWARDNPAIVFALVGAITAIGGLKIILAHNQKILAQKQEHEANMERLRIASDPTLRNAK